MKYDFKINMVLVICMRTVSVLEWQKRRFCSLLLPMCSVDFFRAAVLDFTCSFCAALCCALTLFLIFCYGFSLQVNAVFAADAVSRLSGTIGVAAVTAGPGVTNTVTAMKNAQMAQSPLLLIGGAAATILKVECFTRCV